MMNLTHQSMIIIKQLFSVCMSVYLFVDPYPHKFCMYQA